MNGNIPQIRVPLGRTIHAIASEFAAEQTTAQKGKKIYLNTLAVYAVHSYLKWLQIETDLSQGHSWHPDFRSLFDVADLVVPGVGKLECCPLLPGETALSLPLEVTQARFGYVAVQFEENLSQVRLLGFVSANDVANNLQFISMADLQSLDTLLSYIPAATSRKLVNLSFWQDGKFEAGWQPVNALFGKASSARSVRSIKQVEATSGGKLINLGVQVVDCTVALTIRIGAVADAEVDIYSRVYPTSGQKYLPSGLQLILLDEVGTTSMTATARDADNCLQMQFGVELEELFGIKIILGEFSTEEYFIFS